jgi:hypothetical protein
MKFAKQPALSLITALTPPISERKCHQTMWVIETLRSLIAQNSNISLRFGEIIEIKSLWV